MSPLLARGWLVDCSLPISTFDRAHAAKHTRHSSALERQKWICGLSKTGYRSPGPSSPPAYCNSQLHYTSIDSVLFSPSTLWDLSISI